MQPAINYQLAQAHVAELRQRAQRDTLARAARRGPPEPAEARPLAPRGLGPPSAGRADCPRNPRLLATP